MFKVPDWGNDLPKSDVEVIKTFVKKKKRNATKCGTQPQINNNVSNKATNPIKKSVNAIHKPQSKINGHAKLSKDDHINNRRTRRNLKVNLAEIKNSGITKVASAKTKLLEKGNKCLKRNEVNSKIKNILSEGKHKLKKHASENRNIESKTSENSNSDQLNGSVKDNGGMKSKSLKRKQIEIDKKTNATELNNVHDVQDLSDKVDEILVNAKMEKINDEIKNEDVLFGDNNSSGQDAIVKPAVNKMMKKKKEILKSILNKSSNRSVIKNSGDKLRERMLERLKAAQFRYINEKLYTSSGSESQELFKSDPAAFQIYHEGFQQQVKKWPVNPLDIVVKRIQKMPKSHLVADMGCGDAALSARVAQRVRSFDLVARAPAVEACDMARTPLPPAAADVVVFCLALMGADLTRYLLEANRVLKIGGHLLIAEVESRFDDVDVFCSDVQRLGFGLKYLDDSHQMFVFLEFNKLREAPTKKSKLPTLTLKPCLYKRR